MHRPEQLRPIPGAFVCPLPLAMLHAPLIMPGSRARTPVVKSQASAINAGKIFTAKNNLHTARIYSRRDFLLHKSYHRWEALRACIFQHTRYNGVRTKDMKKHAINGHKERIPYIHGTHISTYQTRRHAARPGWRTYSAF